MKRIFFIFALVVIQLFSFASAQSSTCDLNVTMLNQDPYPAIPGEYVKMVFQVNGVANPACRDVSVELVEEFPISFDPGVSNVVQIKGGTFTQNFPSFLLVPFKVRVDADAIEGDNPLELRYASRDPSTGNNIFKIKKFNLYIEDVRATFEVSVRDYDPSTNTITFEILNTGKSDIEALTIDIASQENFQIIGSNRNIVGSLDSNEDTTFTFRGNPKEGQIVMSITYTDQTDTRRTVQEDVSFTPSNFPEQSNSSSLIFWIIAILVVVIIIYFFWRRAKKKKHHSR